MLRILNTVKTNKCKQMNLIATDYLNQLAMIQLILNHLILLFNPQDVCFLLFHSAKQQQPTLVRKFRVKRVLLTYFHLFFSSKKQIIS